MDRSVRRRVAWAAPVAATAVLCIPGIAAAATDAGWAARAGASVRVSLDVGEPTWTILGGGGFAAALIAGLVLVGTMFAGGGRTSRLLGAVFGALGGAGLALGLTELDILTSGSILAPILFLAGGIIGAVVPGLLNRDSRSGPLP